MLLYRVDQRHIGIGLTQNTLVIRNGRSDPVHILAVQNSFGSSMGHTLRVVGVTGPQIAVIAADNNFSVGFFLGDLAVVQEAVGRGFIQPQVPVHDITGELPGIGITGIDIGRCVTLLPTGCFCSVQGNRTVAPSLLQSLIGAIDLL